MTPNHLLLMRSGDHTVGKFASTDNYVRKRWRQVQPLADNFWLRWRREYLQTLQTRQNWQGVQPNFAVGYIVLLHDTSLPQRNWSIGRVTGTFSDGLGYVRQVLVRTQNGKFKRPILNLCRLLSEDCVPDSNDQLCPNFQQKNINP